MKCGAFGRFSVKFLDDNQLVTICREHLAAYRNIDGFKIYIIPDNVGHLVCEHEVSK